jgi:thioredoxin 1
MAPPQSVHSHPRPSVRVVTELDFDDEVLRAELPVFVDVSAEWCAPCKVAAPVVAALAARHAGALKVVEIDGCASPELAARLGGRGFPTVIGVDQRLGFAGAKPLEALAETILAAARGG